MIKQELFDRVVGYERDSRTRTTEPGKGHINVSEMLHMVEGSKAILVFTMAQTNDGVKAPYFVTFALGPSMIDKYRRTEFSQTAYDDVVMKVRWAQQEGPILQRKYGLKGVYRNEQEGLMSWQEFASRGVVRLPAEIVDAMRRADQVKD